MAVNREEFLKVFDETTGNREQDQELLQSYEQDAKEFLPKLQNNNFPLYGLIGEYGTGKSTFLNAVRYYDQQNSETNNIRIIFEARKYPDRKELWDAFIIDVLSQVMANITVKWNIKNVFQIMDTIKKEMTEGIYNQDDKSTIKSNKSKKLIIENVDSIIPHWIPLLSNCKKVIASIIESTIQDSKEAVSRIFDYEYFFKQNREKIIGKYYNEFDKVYIIIEDIDRCGDDGLVFLETLSYFMNTISKEEYMMDKMTCIVSIGQWFLNDHRHLINKAITSYEIFNMKTDSIVDYFTQTFSKEELWFSDDQQKYLNDFLSVYLNIYWSTTRTIREIKYLFKKILPEMIYKKELLESEWELVSDNFILIMILYNFSLFIRSNRFERQNNSHGGTKIFDLMTESFDSTKPLYYCKLLDTWWSYITWLDWKYHERRIGTIISNNQIFLSLLENDIKFEQIDCIKSIDGNKPKWIFLSKKKSSNPVTYCLLIDKYRLLNS